MPMMLLPEFRQWCSLSFLELALSTTRVHTLIVPKDLRRDEAGVDWSALSQDKRSDIANKIVATLNSIGIKNVIPRWQRPAQLPHWQLVIETSWCAHKSQSDVSRALGQAIARASMYAPINGIVLKSSRQK